ncbi:MAG: transglycosylase domain-containing protein, partial [Candidatus Hydrogenedentes bacterium]|nr:transglycosylase domain-containing protein [Candidatus Hydrogenedentota bacterium]
MTDLDAKGGHDPKPPKRTLRGCGGLFFLVTLCFAAFWGAGLGVFVYILAGVEETIDALDDFRPKVGSKLFSADGAELGEFTIETRHLVTLNEMPLHLQKAFIATEDHTFYEHRGVRPLAFLVAVADSFRTNRLRGASTITQQIVRNIETTGISKEVTVQRKLREMLVALQLERRYTKDEILEMYLNQIFLGISAHGVESATQQYYLKSAADLALSESALLAGLARSPNNNQPFRHPENARKRRNIVLAQMLEHRFITQSEYEIARAESIDSVVTPEERKDLENPEVVRWAPNKFQAPYFSEEIRRFISHPPAPYEVDATEKDLFEGGLEVYTTLDLRLQGIAEEVLLKALDEFDAEKMSALQKRGLEHEFYPVSGALVCLDNR